MTLTLTRVTPTDLLPIEEAGALSTAGVLCSAQLWGVGHERQVPTAGVWPFPLEASALLLCCYDIL